MIKKELGFTLIEIVIVITILGILSAFAIPKFFDTSTAAKQNVIKKIAGTMNSTISIVRSVAFSKGLTPQTSNPGDQSPYLISTEAGSFEIDWRNLCPEARAEMGDQLNFGEHLNLKAENGLSIVFNNQYYRIGYDIQGNGPITANGCYVTYNSFGNPDCTVDYVIEDC